jgi:hypothetical protein
MKKYTRHTFPANKEYMDSKKPLVKKLIAELPNDVAKQQQEKIEELEDKISYYEKRKVDEDHEYNNYHDNNL